MAFFYSPRIITDGLVLYLDAANPYSYVSGSLNWNDLSRSQTSGSLINGPTFSSANGGSIVFDGVNDKVLFGSSSGTNYSNIHTFITWVNITSKTGPGPTIIGHEAFNNGGYAFWFDYSVSNTLYYSPSNGSFAGVLYTFPTNTWFNVSVARNLTNLTWYINGVQIGTGTTSTADLLCSSIGSYRTDNTYTLNGRISNTSIYNRTLSPTEIQQNYNAQKSRFGL